MGVQSVVQAISYRSLPMHLHGRLLLVEHGEGRGRERGYSVTNS